jgi:integrase
MVSSGIRSGELRGLTWQNVLWDKSAILIVQAVKADGSIGLPKTHEVRGIIIPGRAIDLLRCKEGRKDRLLKPIRFCLSWGKW